MSKPFLKWAGGKSRLVPFITSHLPATHGKRLVEPFVGSAALSLALEFDAYLWNDSNIDLINLYEVLKSDKQDFIDFARSFFSPEQNQEKQFYDLRDEFNNSQNIHKKSALFVYLNRHAFNGLCRYNSKGFFNVPFGRYRNPYFPEKEMKAFLDKADRVTLLHGDFREVFSKKEDTDIFYCDPPYVPLSNTASFTAYAQNSFTLDDQGSLAENAKQTATDVSAILVSNHDTEFTREIYKPARIETVNVQRNIAASGTSRQKVSELLAIYE